MQVGKGNDDAIALCLLLLYMNSKDLDKKQSKLVAFRF